MNNKQEPIEPLPAPSCWDLLTALRIQMHQLEMTMDYGGPSEICGAIDAVASALNDLRSTVCSNDNQKT